VDEGDEENSCWLNANQCTRCAPSTSNLIQSPELNCFQVNNMKLGTKIEQTVNSWNFDTWTRCKHALQMDTLLLNPMLTSLCGLKVRRCCMRP
jgi:hypothetical protein